MKTKTLARIFSFLLAFCLVAQLVPAVPAAVAAEGDTITYTFSANEQANWKYNMELTNSSIYFNKGWKGTSSTYSYIYMTDKTRNAIGYDLTVGAAGCYNVAIKTGAAPVDYAVYINNKEVGTIAKGATSTAIESINFIEGVNTLQIKNKADCTSPLQLYSAVLTWVADIAPEEFTLDFTADDQIDDFYNMTIPNQGIRFISHNSDDTVENNTTTGLNTTSFNGYTYATLDFPESTGNYVAFDFKADEAGNYDILISAEDNNNHGANVNVYVNATGTKADETGGTLVGGLDNSHITGNATRQTAIKNATGTTYNNVETIHYVGGASLRKGHNSLHFKTVEYTGSPSVNRLYFRKVISLADSDVANATFTGVEKKTFAAIKDTATATVKAPARGLYYLYVKANTAAVGSAFGGYASVDYIAPDNKVTNIGKQYIDFSNGYYSHDAANSAVIRPVGPLWLDAGKEYTITFTELIGAGTSLDLTALELHQVKKNLWLEDEADQNFGDVTISTHGWELDKANTGTNYYLTLTLGAYNNKTTYLNSFRTSTATDLNLGSGQVAFKFNVPADGTYEIKGNFYANKIANNPIVLIPGTALNSKVNIANTDNNKTLVNKQIGVVDLKAGENSIVFWKGDGENYLYLKNLTFTPYEGATVEGVDVTLGASEITVGAAGTTATATVKMSDDSAAPEGTTVTWKSSDTKVATVDAATGAITAVGAGEATITATANILGVNYTGSAKITVKAAPVVIPESDVFGSVYAYVKDDTVYFLGGLKAIEGYTEVGFEVTVNGEKVDDIKTSEVFKSFKVKDQTVNASDWASSYIFITSTDELNAGDKVVVKPYVSNGTAKIYHEGLGALELDI